MSAEDGFEEELARRLGLRASAVGGSPPLAALKAAGRRRARQQGAVRGVTAVAVLAVGAGALTQLGGGGTASDERVGGGPAGAPTGGAASPSAGRNSGKGRMVFGCDAGPSSLRTPGQHWHPTDLPTGPPRITPTSTTPPVSPSLTPPPFTPPSFTPPSFTPPSFTPRSGLPSTGSPSTLSSAQLLQLDLARASEAVDKVGTESYADHYFGVCRDPGLNTLYVMRVPGDGALDDAVTRALADWPTVKLQFTAAVGSYAELRELQDRIDGDRAYWKDKGVQLEFVQVANDGSGVVVDTPQWESAGAQIKAKYGSKVAEVR
ncbi:hypothetical protein ACFVSN_32670 [Kitasatospora sp. NPDC057904]|uniref:hypothetical protein n=1 Tax=Kitasatospora sp. NPDC057904 TaxID=3346275 RepID=UPI0036D7AC65